MQVLLDFLDILPLQKTCNELCPQEPELEPAPAKKSSEPEPPKTGRLRNPGLQNNS